jgi:hypothetical protein
MDTFQDLTLHASRFNVIHFNCSIGLVLHLDISTFKAGIHHQCWVGGGHSLGETSHPLKCEWLDKVGKDNSIITGGESQIIQAVTACWLATLT